MNNKCPHCGSYSLINDGWETYCLLCSRQPAPTSSEIAAKQRYPVSAQRLTCGVNTPARGTDEPHHDNR